MGLEKDIRRLIQLQPRFCDNLYDEIRTNFKHEIESTEEKPSKPIERKWLYEVATIQAVLRRSLEQKNCGQVLNRNELSGLFKSLGQVQDETEAHGLSSTTLRPWLLETSQ